MHRALIAVLAISLLLNLVPIWWGLPSFQGWAYDEILPADVESAAAWPPKYPPAHRHLLRLALLPLDALEALGLVNLDTLERYSLAYLMLRLVSVLMATATVYLVYRCTRTLWPRGPSVAAAAMIALMPPFVYYAKTANLDAPYLFWFAGSLYFYLRALRRRRARDFVLFALFGALSICTKDQAYGLYLLTPLPLIAALWRERGWRAVIDRRVWLAALAVIAVVVLVYELFLGPGELRRHVAAALAPRTFSVETATPTGQMGRLALAAHQVSFSLGLPFALLAAGGAVVAFRRRPRESVALAAMIAGYYGGFILLLPYQTVRYLLPVAMIGGLFAAGALTAARVWRPRTPYALALGAMFAFALVRAVWVDRSMLADSRYEVERWLAEASPDQPALGLGRQHMMPRGVVASSFHNLTTGGCRFLNEKRPSHIVVNLADVRDQREAAVVRRLGEGAFNYREALRHRSTVGPGLRGLDRVLSNLDKINPEIVVFARREQICLDSYTLPEALAELRQGRPSASREQLAEVIVEGDIDDRARPAGSAEAVAFGLHFGGWTRGTAPAAVVVTNDRKRPMVAVLELLCLAPAGAYPVMASIDDGAGRRTVSFARRGRKDARIGPLAPGERRLLLVWADRAWRRPPDDRVLGFAITEVRLQRR